MYSRRKVVARQQKEIEKLNTYPKLFEAAVQAAYSDAALERACTEYSFKYKIEDDTYTVSYDPQKGEILSCAEHGELFDLAQEIEHVLTELEHHFDTLQVRRFLCKHLQAMNKVGQASQVFLLSERTIVD